MTTTKPDWSDFYNENLGPLLPLTENQRKIPVSGVLPSGEHGGFDNSQFHKVRSEAKEFIGSGINVPHPYPNINTPTEYAYSSGDITGKFTDQWWATSGIIKTYPSSDGALSDKNRESGIFHYDIGTNRLGKLATSGRFSNGEDVLADQISDFKIFNKYIHHEKVRNQLVEIPYISTFRVSIDWNPYRRG